MASAFNYRVFRWVLTPVPLPGCLTQSEPLPGPQTRHVAVALPVTLTWPRSRWALSSMVGSAVLDALALFFQRQPARNVVELHGVGQVDQNLRDDGHRQTRHETFTQRQDWLMSKGSESPFRSAASYLSGQTDEADVIKLQNTNAFDNSNIQTALTSPRKSLEEDLS